MIPDMTTYALSDYRDQTKFLTYTVAAARYGVSVRQLQYMADRGEITRHRLPHRRPSVFLPVEELEALFGPAIEHKHT